MAEEKRNAPVYLSFGTFKNVIEAFVKFLPNKIDRTAFEGQSGGVQGQILAGLRFLMLIDADGNPTKDLIALTKTDEGGRKALLKQILTVRYAPLFAIKLEGAAFGQLESAMTTHYSVSSETKEKAIRFFLSACRYAGVPLSPLLMKANTAPTTRKRKPRSTTGGDAKGESSSGNGAAPPPPPSGNTRSVTLKSGAGVVNVSMAIDMFGLNDYDDTWVRKLVEHLRSYNPPAEESDDDAEEDDFDEGADFGR